MGAVVIKAVKTSRERGGVVLGEGTTQHPAPSRPLRALSGGLGQNSGSHRDLGQAARCEGEPMVTVPGSRSRGLEGAPVGDAAARSSRPGSQANGTGGAA